MNLTLRVRKVVKIMLEEDRVIQVQELADRIGISKRTLQRELEYIQKDLAPYHITFETKTGKGVWLSGKREDKQALLGLLQQGDEYDVSNKEERRKRLILEILKDKGLKKLFYYASQFQVSEATISTDLEAIEDWLLGYDLTISRKPGSGVEIQGTEENYRKAIRVFIEDNMDTDLLKEAYGVRSEAVQHIYQSGINQIIKDDVLKRVIHCVSDMNSERLNSLTENSYVGFIIHISIAISRIMKHEIMEQKENLYEQMAKDEDFYLAQEVVVKLEREFDIKIPAIEVAYICLHIKGAKHQSIEWNGEKSVAIEKKELLNLVNDMIDAYDEKQAFALKQDNEFIQGLLAHLQPTFIRLRYDMKISNPVLEDIKKSYPEIFEKSRRAAAVIERWIGKKIPEEEIGFLTIHFGAAQVRLEDRSESIRCVKVGIVCASGIGISRMMLSKLGKLFKEHIQLETYGQKDITPYIIGRTDFFVSSIALKDIDADVIMVNPLLSEEDIKKIQGKVYYYERIPKKEKEETTFSVQLEEINILAMQIKTILRYLDVFKVSNDINFGELLEAVAERLSPYGDRQAMIQEDIEAREKLGSQVFAEFGFALLHTRTQGVTRPSFSVCLTKDRKAFTNPYFKGIQVILVMLLPVDEHIRINSEILGFISSTLIEDYDFLLTVSGGDQNKIETALSMQLKKFFNQYLNKLQQT